MPLPFTEDEEDPWSLQEIEPQFLGSPATVVTVLSRHHTNFKQDNEVEPKYDTGLWDTLYITSDILCYRLIPHC
jgi:hypothetical protein